jgi:hypothetical protein
MREAGGTKDNIEARDRFDSTPVLLSTQSSSLVEKALEYRFLAAVTGALLKRSMPFEVLRSDVDCNGHDLIIEAAGVVRHIQLKAMVTGGRRASITVHTHLATKPSGCVVWMLYDPATFEIVSFRWFGADAGLPMPLLGGKIARHSRGNAAGIKGLRGHHRIVAAGRFRAVQSVSELVDRLFWPGDNSDPIRPLRTHLSGQPPMTAAGWLDRVRSGDFGAIPHDLAWETSAELAHLIDGYALAAKAALGDPIAFAERQLCHARAAGTWPDGPLELWVSLFMDHRRWRFSSPFEPNQSMVRLLDKLVQQLRRELLSRPDRHGEEDA